MDAHGDVWGPRGAKSSKAGHFGVHFRPVINPMTIGMFRGAIWVPFWIQLAPFGIPLGHLWGLISLTFRGCLFSSKKEVQKPPRTSKASSFWEPFWLHFSSFFITFLKTSKQVLALPYSTFEGFCSPKALILGSSFGSVFGPFLDPSKRRPPGRTGLNHWPPRGHILVRRGEDLGGGFVDSSRFR